MSSEPDDPDPDESDPEPDPDEPDREFDLSSVPEPEVDEPLFEDPELGELVDPGVESPEGVLVGPRGDVLSSEGEGVAPLGDVTSRGASGARAGTRSVGVERSRPATMYALNVSVMARPMPPRAHARPFIRFRTTRC